MGESHRLTLPRGLGSKIILPTLLVIGMFAFPALLAWQGMLSIQSKNESMRSYSQALVDLHEVEAGLQAEAAAFNRILESSDPAATINFAQAGNLRSQRLASLDNLADFAPEISWIDELRLLDDQAQNLLSTESGATWDPGRVQAATIELESIHGRMRLLVSSLIESLETRSNEAAASLNADAQNTVRTVIPAMVLTGLLGLGLAVLLTRRITRPVRALACAAQNLSKGKLGQRVEIRGKDELARLGRAFNHMASSLQLQNYALLNEQSKLRSVHQSITDGILVFGNNGFIISANPAAKATIKKEEAMLAGSRSTGIVELDEILARPELIGPDDMIACWEYNDCRQEECPSYKSEDLRCWLQCGTYCHNEIQESFTQKRDTCERCPVYRANGCVTVDAEADGNSYSPSPWLLFWTIRAARRVGWPYCMT